HAEHYQRILIQATQAQEQARREAQEAATGTREGNGNAAPTEREEETAAETEQPTIGGMDMIDSEPAKEPLIVEAETPGEQPRKRNGDGRRRRRSEPEAAAIDESAPAQAAPTEPQVES
ncbi:MAG: hypothetical protein AAGC57_21890, partial [Pseudomonadota bacterium]